MRLAKLRLILFEYCLNPLLPSVLCIKIRVQLHQIAASDRKPLFPLNCPYWFPRFSPLQLLQPSEYVKWHSCGSCRRTHHLLDAVWLFSFIHIRGRSRACATVHWIGHLCHKEVPGAWSESVIRRLQETTEEKSQRSQRRKEKSCEISLPPPGISLGLQSSMPIRRERLVSHVSVSYIHFAKPSLKLPFRYFQILQIRGIWAMKET